MNAEPQIIPPSSGNTIRIVYCTQCKWAIRANWMQQELFQSFTPSEITQITLQPNEEGPLSFALFLKFWTVGGIFQIYANEKLLWDRKAHARFPEITELKRLVRDELVPEKKLGHADSVSSKWGFIYKCKTSIINWKQKYSDAESFSPNIVQFLRASILPNRARRRDS